MDYLQTIIGIGDDVWKNWGLLTTINLAIIGWLMSRHGLYNRQEKIIATVVNVVFILIIQRGMIGAYEKLDMASNDLAYHYLIENMAVPKGGIVENFISKSPKYCQCFPSIEKCKKYSSVLPVTLLFVWLSFAANLGLFWSEKFWAGSRKTHLST